MKWLLFLTILVGFLLRARAIESAVDLLDQENARSLTPLDRENCFFDPDAEVLLFAGKDRLPGRAGIDDDFNGIVDDLSELGAIYGDDICLTPADANYKSIREGSLPWRVISVGAWVKS
ncbi:hypothetical protein Q31b_40120 [Novipirellula aureliae]|uniref:Uncharacterized protein n=1 Tax=Novipirellula aureliae TaxID=2527966 RepID=A0A5C6DRZ9_9BACT|nr:hypothetical protein [Novipirellula aureliae]TWU38934.1 hypothetical protein Q31b_40120 [Novipirellula aureliae]